MKKIINGKIFSVFIIVSFLLAANAIVVKLGLSSPIYTNQSHGVVQGIAYDRNPVPMSHATIKIDKKTQDDQFIEEFTVRTNESGYYSVKIEPTMGNYVYYIWIDEGGLNRGEAKTYAIIQDIEDQETINVDLYQVGAVFYPLDVVEGDLTDFFVEIRDPNMIKNNFVGKTVMIQFTLIGNTKEYNITKSFVDSWIQSPVENKWIYLGTEFHDALLHAEVQIGNNVLYIKLLPFISNEGGTQIMRIFGGSGGNHLAAGIGFNIIPGKDIYVTEGNYPPIPIIKCYPTKPNKDEIVFFDGSFSEDPDGEIVSYKWNFGDGTFADGITVNHSFSWGVFNITLTATDNEGKSWISNITVNVIDDISPEITIKKPDKGYIYIFDREIMPFPETLIIGKITVETEVYDAESEIEKVEFYVDNELKETTREQYEWLWDETTIGSFTIKAVAYDNAGNAATDEQMVWIFNP